MAFMLVCAYDPSVDGDVVGNERISYNSLFQAEVFGRMAGIDRIDPGFKLLSIRAGMNNTVGIVMVEDGHSGDCIADKVICLPERLKPDKIVRCGGQHIVADVGYLAHFAQSHIGSKASINRQRQLANSMTLEILTCPSASKKG